MYYRANHPLPVVAFRWPHPPKEGVARGRTLTRCMPCGILPSDALLCVSLNCIVVWKYVRPATMCDTMVTVSIATGVRRSGTRSVIELCWILKDVD